MIEVTKNNRVVYKGQFAEEHDLTNLQWAYCAYWAESDPSVPESEIARQALDLVGKTSCPSLTANRYKNSDKVKKVQSYLLKAQQQENDRKYTRERLTPAEAAAICSRIARAKVTDFVDLEGRLRPEHEIPDTSAIKKIRTMTKDGTTYAEVELKDSMKAIEQVSKIEQWNTLGNAEALPQLHINIGTEPPQRLTGGQTQHAIDTTATPANAGDNSEPAPIPETTDPATEKSDGAGQASESPEEADHVATFPQAEYGNAPHRATQEVKNTAKEGNTAKQATGEGKHPATFTDENPAERATGEDTDQIATSLGTDSDPSTDLIGTQNSPDGDTGEQAVC